jgi:hypothetical protein
MGARSFWYWAGLALGVLGAGAGCGDSRLIKVKGVVTLDGKPVAGAIVMFLPEGASGQPANGLSGPDGGFTLTTRNTDDGALPGDYRVAVTKITSELTPMHGISDPKEVAKVMTQSMFKKPGQRRAKAKEAVVIPAIYGDRTKTPLKSQVPPPSGKVVLDLRNTGGT